MKMLRFEDQLAALDAFATRDDAVLAGSTRLRIRATLERGHAWRRHASLLAALAVLLVASASWALATGRLHRWLTPPRVLHSALPPLELPAEEAPVIASSPTTATVHEAPPAPARPHVTAHAEPDRLYARAHELHFHGGDPAAALAAWDAYLAAEPRGAFAVEARYNRALCLVRLGRLTDARGELEPFARGEIAPRGYRQPDAAQLIERIDRHIGAVGATNSLNGSP
jgi:hypothetical protein